MTEPEPDWPKIMAERRKNLLAICQHAQAEAHYILDKIARMSANAQGTPFATALQFDRKEMEDIQAVLRDWLQRTQEMP